MLFRDSEFDQSSINLCPVCTIKLVWWANSSNWLDKRSSSIHKALNEYSSIWRAWRVLLESIRWTLAICQTCLISQALIKLLRQAFIKHTSGQFDVCLNAWQMLDDRNITVYCFPHHRAPAHSPECLHPSYCCQPAGLTTITSPWRHGNWSAQKSSHNDVAPPVTAWFFRPAVAADAVVNNVNNRRRGRCPPAGAPIIGCPQKSLSGRQFTGNNSPPPGETDFSLR